MTLRAGIHWLCAITLLFSAASCGKHSPEKTDEERQREHELKLFTDSIRTVQERYVDADQVHIDQIISNSLKGMVASIDPYATIRFTGNPSPEIIPPDVPLAELTASEWPEIMMLKIYSFGSPMKKQLREIESRSRGIDPAGFLIDCRGASGDDYSAVVEICELFLPRDTTIGTILEKQGSVTRPLITRSQPRWPTNTIVVLIDSQTDGPAELLASALHHHKRAMLIGEPSRGVAVVQSPIPVIDNWIVMLSTGRVLDPTGTDITGHALIPMVTVRPDPEEKEGVDFIYQRGMTALRDAVIVTD
jgi:C-terminal processing protease CtpA/Prc